MIRKLFFAMTALLVFTAVVRAADVTGKWVAQVAGRNGTQEVTFTLKSDGGAITGTVNGGGGGRGPAGPQQISDGKIDGDKVSFTVKADVNGQTRVTTYSGTISGDTLQLKQTREGRNGPQTADVSAKRSTT